MKWTCRGFRFAGVSAGVKASGKLDLGLLVSELPATAAAVFTRNRAKAAPVRLSQAVLRRNGAKIRAIVVNSGNANASTGRQGMQHARRMVDQTARELHIQPDQVLVASTGIIGTPLPMNRIETGITNATSVLRRDGFPKFAESILTTDKNIKLAVHRFKLAGRTATILGCTKGAGMIAPNMATTLTFLATDAAVHQATMQAALRSAAEDTFNSLIIDGDTSTNDMIAVLANGTAGNKKTRSETQISDAMRHVLEKLARALVRDGEGVHHVVDVIVRRAKNFKQARAISREISRSSLVKTAIAGCDPNWGRIICAAGNAGVPLALDKLDLWIGKQQLVKHGIGVASAQIERRAAKEMSRPSYSIIVELNQGDSQAQCLACDLSHEYVSINADYRT